MCSLLEAQNSDGQTALHLACRRGSAELVEAILEYREANVDVLDKDGDPPLIFALAAGSPECIRVLIERGTNVRSSLREGFGPSVGHVCAYHGQPDCMRVCPQVKIPVTSIVFFSSHYGGIILYILINNRNY